MSQRNHTMGIFSHEEFTKKRARLARANAPGYSVSSIGQDGDEMMLASGDLYFRTFSELQ